MKKFLVLSFLLSSTLFAEVSLEVTKPSVDGVWEAKSDKNNESEIVVLVGDQNTPRKGGSHGDTEKQILLKFSSKNEAKLFADQILRFANGQL